MSEGGKIIIFTLLLIFLEAAFVASSCNNNGPRIQCGAEGSNDNRGVCLKNKRCCFNKADGKPNCFVNMGQNFKNDLYSAKSRLGTPPSRQISKQSLSMAARNLNVSESEKRGFEGRAGSFSSGSMDAVFGFPTCPLKVPMCQRLRCQPYNAASERNPMECYKDPRCCFDASLFVHKYIFGDSYMGNAPVCFLGPTSPRFVEITKSIQPWSPFYLEPVVRIFERYFDLNIDFNQVTQCLTANLFDIDMFRTPKCGWQGITKLECNLKGCCYNTKTGNCAYPGHLFGSRFGMVISAPTYNDRQQFPELFQISTTQCTQYGLGTDPFEVFQRLPCAQGTPKTGVVSSSIVDLYKTCPSSCCKSMMSLFPGVGDLSLSGSPSKYAFMQSQYNGYAGNSMFNQLFVNLFCPYFYSKIPELGDLTESVKGCCKQTTCYHKRLGGGVDPLSPGGSWGNWVAWSSCEAACGVQGQRSRERYCMANGILRDSSVCGGGSPRETTYCTGDCTRSTYSWGQWGGYGTCSGPCGRGGSRSRSRSCQNNMGITNNNCPGSGTESVGCTSPPCRNQCQWANWAPTGACSISCYYGSLTSGVQKYGRVCKTSSGQMCTGCPGANNELKRCSVPPCLTQCQWSQWAASGSCSKTCHSQGTPSNGVQSFRRQCQGSQVCTGRCQGSSYRTGSCSVPQCQDQCQWSTWTPSGSCSISCYPEGRPAQGVQTNRRVCQISTGVMLSSSVSCSSCPGSNYITSGCSVPECRSSYRLTGWGPWSRCDASCKQQRRQKCELNGNLVDPTKCNAGVEQKSCDFGLCPPSQPWVSWSPWSVWTDCTPNVRSQMRWRQCLFKGSQSAGDDICTGVYKTNPTETRLCPGSGGGGNAPAATYTWSNWSAYSRCTGRCGLGLQTRTRRCINSSTVQQTGRADVCGYGKTSDSKACYDALLCLFSP